ncbi:hypothetical protein Hbl1158_10190 [Halobaculum sp. CBA1158]|uniref:hypothetical protein n=1 Tax=Halobaculum sp. CBA1158 TaxID=2904243 RepID=UPI001F2B9F5E|nr:hypothetical protein [Halobaculum sp. CBA1158]UIO98903.1 hypothetical protein Hbl1158_10190 [Halobaculum sp. CBA1158]
MGGGEHATQIAFAIQATTTLPDGSTPNWGDGSANELADASASESAVAMQSVLMRYWRAGTPDSLAPGTLRWGQYGDEAPALDILVEQPQLRVPVGENTLTGSITLVDTFDLRTALSRRDTPE